MRGVWGAFASCKVALITRGAKTFVIKGPPGVHLENHQNLLNRVFTGAGGGPWGQGWSGDKKQSTATFFNRRGHADAHLHCGLVRVAKKSYRKCTWKNCPFANAPQKRHGGRPIRPGSGGGQTGGGAANPAFF
jgi:hypothetical protein